MTPDRYTTILDERAAVERLLEELREGDLAVILVDDVRGVLKILEPRAALA
jgi:hypothetical protein